MTRERVSGATFDEVVDIARQIEMVRGHERIEMEAKRPRGQGGFSGAPYGGQFQHGRGRPLRHAQPSRPVHPGASSDHGSHNSYQVHSSLSALLAQNSSRTPSVQGSSMPGIVSVCHRDASVLFDPGSTYSYVSSFFTHFLDMPRKSLVSSVHVSTPVGDTIVVDRVYRSCVVSIEGLETQKDLLLLSMVDFDVILGMD
ncbi:uncharacterized protein [Nicotiana tomentosiformis]|uniref:uncharacterized protein n=1 Tax=Nicotiana tomentosiformis TaxID=4098 RepID=UPI00388C392E